MGVDPEIACGIVENIGELWLNGQFNDLQIHVGDMLFNCNRFILCACSKFFKVLLKSEVKGEVEHPIKQVTVTGISPEIFQLILKAVYQGENGLSTENMVEFWHAVNQLEIPVLISKCETFLSSHLTVENFVNIYQHALLLKSRNVITAAHHFVAKNLESSKELDFLLQQPVSCIEEIIGDDSLVGQSQNHVVEFILKWINYELCASEGKFVSADSTMEDLSAQTSEGEPVSAVSTVGDLSIQTSKVTGNKHESVEVIFQKPCATVSDDFVRNLSGQSLVRKQSLGKLLKQVRFSEVSQDSLEILADSDLVMGSKETRDIVRQALKSASSIDTECVVFVSRYNSSTICAYSLDTGEIFEFLSPGPISNIRTHHNKLLCRVLCDPSSNNPYMLKVTEFPFSKGMRVIDYVRSDSVFVENLCYTFKYHTHMYRRNIENDDRWIQLFPLPDKMSSPSLAVLNNTILVYNSTFNRDGQQEVYCYNRKLSSKRWLMMTCDFEDCDFVTFSKDEQLYILYGNGMCVDVTDNVISRAKTYSLSQNPELFKSLKLWDFQFKIYGAVVHQDSLVVFGDLTSASVSKILKCKILGLKVIKFVHLYGLLSKCHPLVIPKVLLKNTSVRSVLCDSPL